MPIKISKERLMATLKDYVFITFGIALYAFGFTAFILPEKIVIGGLAGIGSLIYFTTGIPVAISQFALNLLLLSLAYKLVGKKFVMGTLYGAFMISVFVGVFQPLFAAGFTHEPFMNIVIGGAICGMGIGTCFIHHGSSGGTDIVAAMVSKHSNFSIGRVMIFTDVIIISSSYFIFHEIDKIVYGLVVLFLISTMTDMIINSSRQAVQFFIFSRKWEEIACAINNDASRGCTVIDATGWYSKQPVKVLMVMCRKVESGLIFRIIKSIDPDAFISQANVNGVYGKGFDELKLKMKPAPNANADLHTKIEADVASDLRHHHQSTSEPVDSSSHPIRMA